MRKGKASARRLSDQGMIGALSAAWAKAAAWSRMLSSPGSALSFAATKIQLCRAQDLAYEIGHYRLTVNDQEGVPQTSQGKYVVVWAKQAGK